MGETHINVWQQNTDDEGIEVSFRVKHVSSVNQKPAYELAFRTKSGTVISFWTTAPENLAILLANAYRAIATGTEIEETSK